MSIYTFALTLNAWQLTAVLVAVILAITLAGAAIGHGADAMERRYDAAAEKLNRANREAEARERLADTERLNPNL
jgi:hypothetical protein